jgi:transcriptional regulator with XRE-family HTH domain
MDKLPQAALNIRYFLWKKKGVPANGWSRELSNLLSCERTRAEELLWSGRLSHQELMLLAEDAGVTEESFLNSPFIEERIDILSVNLVYLFESLEHGGQKRFAESIGISPVNITRWKSGETKINAKHLMQIKEFFGLASAVDLQTDPIFLSLTPYGDQNRRRWLNERMKEIDEDSLRRLFPAFERLFRK